jgi:ATP-dependent exoDNAse (exonuclease V) beta subunit
MTAHAEKGLEFHVVILCDPTAQLAQTNSSRYVDTANRRNDAAVIKISDHAPGLTAEQGGRLIGQLRARRRDGRARRAAVADADRGGRGSARTPMS